MRVNTEVSLRNLPVALKLNNSVKYNPPIKTDGYIINPHKFKNDIKDESIDIKEIKQLLLMMLRGDSNFINELVKNGSNTYVNTVA